MKYVSVLAVGFLLGAVVAVFGVGQLTQHQLRGLTPAHNGWSISGMRCKGEVGSYYCARLDGLDS